MVVHPLTALAALLLTVSLGSILALWQVQRLRRALARGVREAGEIRALAAMRHRSLTLAAQELRQITLSLQGCTDRLSLHEGASIALSATLGGLHVQCANLADALEQQAQASQARPSLQDEAVPLTPLIAEVVHDISAALYPGVRNWRVSANLTGLVLTADSRALRQILLRVLANAARLSAHGDWIEISCAARESSFALYVEDEGAGLAASDPDASGAALATRGIGLALALARSLTEAHGGSLLIESAARIGTRVSLLFPANRLLRQEWQGGATPAPLSPA
jgi:signal transduction histidine kinase